MDVKKLSFIIPAFNEEANIANTLQHIKKHAPADIDYEIIVVDHGSTDRTIELGRANGAIVLSQSDGTVAGLRNYGVKASVGEILIFLDADILLTKEWEMNIKNTINRYQKGERILTGSRCSIPNNPSWIEAYWFKSLEEINNKHINSGHMIITRDLFNELGGFSENLATGEDYDLSVRAADKNITIIDDHNIKVIHEGYPKSLWKFILREYWHGKGDATSLYTIMSSKVAIIGITLIFLHILLIASLVHENLHSISLLLMLFIILLPIGMALYKFKSKNLATLIVNSLIYYFYLMARGSSTIINLLRKTPNKKRQR